MEITRFTKFIFFNFILIYFIYIGLAGIAFPKQGIISVVFPGFAFLFLLRLVLKGNFYKFSIWIYSYLLFLAVLTLFSSDIFISLKAFLKVTMTFMLLPISFQIIRNIDLFKRINMTIVLLMVLYLVNFFVMNFLGISFKGYGDDITTGNIFTEGLNAMAYALVILPTVILISQKRKWWIILIGITVFITLLISLKRISILAVLLGYLIFLFSLKKKKKMIKGGIGILILLVVSYPLYSEILHEQIDNRSSRFENDSIENEGRYKETIIIFENVFSFEDISYSLLGKELFNSSGTYGRAIKWGDRQLHSDYNLLLHGSGLIGIIYYLFVQGIIFLTFRRFKRNIYKIYGYSKELDYINAAFYSVFCLSFFISLSGGINGVIFNSLRYLFLGSVMGLYYSFIYSGDEEKHLNDFNSKK